MIRCRPVVHGCLSQPVVSKFILATDIARFGGFEPTLAFDVIDVLTKNSQYTSDPESLEWRNRVKTSERTEEHWAKVRKVAAEIVRQVSSSDNL